MHDPHSPVPTPSLGLALGALEDAFQRIHAREHAVAAHVPTAVQTAHSASTPESSEELGAHDEPLLEGPELLAAAREPIEWLLTLAHRLAANQPEEIAAVDRLRAAFHARLAGQSIGVRMSDVLAVFALLISALDRGVVLEGVTRTIADGLSMLLTYEGFAIAAQLARMADRLPIVAIQHARAPRRCRGRTPRPHPSGVSSL